MKRIIALLAMAFIILPLTAQVNKESFEDYQKRMKKEMKQFTDSVQQDYYQFRQKANEEYARFMRERWEEFQSMKGEPTPTLPEPPQPYKREKDTPIPELPIRFDNVIVPKPSPKPVEPLKRPETPVIPSQPSLPEFHFTCYGTPCVVHLDKDLSFKLRNISENAVADAWSHLSSELSEVLLEDLLNIRENLALCDWAYYCLVRDFSEQCLGKGTGEAVVMETFMMAQSGYNVRISRKDDHLIILLPFDGMVYETTYLSFNGECFYDVEGGRGEKYYAFNRSFTENNRALSLRMPRTPKFAFKSCAEKTFSSKRYPELNATLQLNKNLVDFYNGYPKCQWPNYSWAGLSDEVKTKLYPVLRKGIEGKSQIEAANRLINFVQTAFEYKTDGEQFGCERSLFADETFYYPYSDCEDRSILFSILVKDLLNLDVVLIQYPDHLATAVQYTETLNGVNFTLDGKTYYVSDPTYIGANVGECMPQYSKTRPTVYKLN